MRIGPNNRVVYVLLSDNRNVTDVTVKTFEGLTSVREIHLGNTNITDAGLNELRKALPRTQYPAYGRCG